jgi:hypothetical protein
MKPDFSKAAKLHTNLMGYDYTHSITSGADFIEGANHGYSEAMKEQRGFRELIIDYFLEKELMYVDQVHRRKFHELETAIKKHLSSFTEHSR